MFFGAVGFSFNLCSLTNSCTTSIELNNESLQNALNVFFMDPITTLVLYYDDCGINCWNTAKITSTKNLFKNQVNFNKDISKWKMSNVSTMEVRIFGKAYFVFIQVFISYRACL